MINVVFKDWAKQLNSQEVSESTKSAILYYMYKEHQKLEPQTKEYFDLLTEIETTIEDLLSPSICSDISRRFSSSSVPNNSKVHCI